MRMMSILVQQNMGAAVRAAYFLGASGILTCARNSAPLSPAVSKASAGALEFMPIHACTSMPRTLTQAAQQGWHVIGEPSCLLMHPTPAPHNNSLTQAPQGPEAKRKSDKSFQQALSLRLTFAKSKIISDTMVATQIPGCGFHARVSMLGFRSDSCTGAGNEADATSCRSFKPDAPSILVVGNEGRGLRPVVRRACKGVLRIDSAAATDEHFSPVGVESLNVSVAAGILLHQLLHPQ